MPNEDREWISMIRNHWKKIRDNFDDEFKKFKDSLNNIL